MARARLRVSIATPDGATTSTRGLGQWLSRVSPGSARGDVSVAIVSDRRMRALNRQFRGNDKTTDVLSFAGVGKPEGLPPRTSGPAGKGKPGLKRALERAEFLGDIVIASGVAAKQARAAGHSVVTEVRVLALHGLLHLLGYDHEDMADRGRMARVELRLRKMGGLKEGLVERSRQ